MSVEHDDAKSPLQKLGQVYYYFYTFCNQDNIGYFSERVNHYLDLIELLQ
jgi:hypothetical protein